MPKGKHRKTAREERFAARLRADRAAVAGHTQQLAGIGHALRATERRHMLTDADAREIVRALRDLNRRRGYGDDGSGIRV